MQRGSTGLFSIWGLLINIAALAIFSCGCSGSTGLCDGVSCTDHSSCKVANDRAVCNCEAGFVMDGTVCVLEPTVDNFTAGAEYEPCQTNIPVCQTTAGCTVNESMFLEGDFPGILSFVVDSPADMYIEVRIFFETTGDPGEDTEILWYEPGCMHNETYQSGGADIFSRGRMGTEVRRT